MSSNLHRNGCPRASQRWKPFRDEAFDSSFGLRSILRSLCRFHEPPVTSSSSHQQGMRGNLQRLCWHVRSTWRSWWPNEKMRRSMQALCWKLRWHERLNTQVGAVANINFSLQRSPQNNAASTISRRMTWYAYQGWMNQIRSFIFSNPPIKISNHLRWSVFWSRPLRSLRAHCTGGRFF